MNVHAFGREDWRCPIPEPGGLSLQANLRLTLTNVNSALVISTLMVTARPDVYVGTQHVLAAH